MLLTRSGLTSLPHLNTDAARPPMPSVSTRRVFRWPLRMSPPKPVCHLSCMALIT